MRAAYPFARRSATAYAAAPSLLRPTSEAAPCPAERHAAADRSTPRPRTGDDVWQLRAALSTGSSCTKAASWTRTSRSRSNSAASASAKASSGARPASTGVHRPLLTLARDVRPSAAQRASKLDDRNSSPGSLSPRTCGVGCAIVAHTDHRRADRRPPRTHGRVAATAALRTCRPSACARCPLPVRAIRRNAAVAAARQHRLHPVEAPVGRPAGGSAQCRAASACTKGPHLPSRRGRSSPRATATSRKTSRRAGVLLYGLDRTLDFPTRSRSRTSGLGLELPLDCGALETPIRHALYGRSRP